MPKCDGTCNQVLEPLQKMGADDRPVMKALVPKLDDFLRRPEATRL